MMSSSNSAFSWSASETPFSAIDGHLSSLTLAHQQRKKLAGNIVRPKNSALRAEISSRRAQIPLLQRNKLKIFFTEKI